MEEVVITNALSQPPTLLRDGMWTATVDLGSKWHAHPEDRRKPKQHRPLTERSRRWAQMLGATTDEVVVYVVHEHRTTPNMYGYASIERKVQLVSTKPFVVVRVTEPDEYSELSSYGFVSAQQVHGGRLGRKPYLTLQPGIASSYMRDPGIGLNRTVNWVRLSELVEITGIDAADIIRDYAPFSPSTMYEPNVPLARGARSRMAYPDVIRIYTDAELPQDYCAHETGWGGDNAATLDDYFKREEWVPQELWVPQTFANRVIRLGSFGFRLGQSAPEASCQIAAPMPDQPQLPLPILPVEELKELHELRMELSQELPQQHFRQAALSALGLSRTTAWCEAPESTDELGNGFAYFTNFEQIERDASDGHVVIGACDWSRAGEVPGDEYYAGFLAVFPPGITVYDARRNPNAILRIWFWPGELVRCVPNGSKGGLCPPEVPSGCAQLVQHFLLGLGYDY